MRWSTNTGYEDRIQHLENELFKARYAIIGLMTDEMQNLLKGYYHCKSRKEGYEWESQVVDKIVAIATPIPAASYFSERANCPLCGRGAQSPYEQGFSIPDGLSRHLGGTYNARQCDVTEAAFTLAREYWHKQFSEAENAERIAEYNHTIERSKTETLFLTAPDKAPGLIDESIYSLNSARTPEQLAWAEQRVQSLGFQITMNNRIKSYTEDTESYIVYADPREVGHIYFRVYKKNYTKSGKLKLTQAGYRFDIQDRWKNDLRGKYDKSVESCLTSKFPKIGR